MKKIYTLLIALTVLILMAASASAVPSEPKVEVEAINGLEAFSYVGYDNGMVIVAILETKGDTYLLYVNGFTDESGQHEYALEDGTYLFDYPYPLLKINQKDAYINPQFLLASLSVSDVNIKDYSGNGPDETINLNVEWTYISDLMREVPFDVRDDDGDISVYYSALRYATIDGTISGSDNPNIDMDLGDLFNYGIIGRALSVNVDKVN